MISCISEKKPCLLGLDDDSGNEMLAAFQVMCVVCSALTQGVFQFELMRTLTLCYNAIERLEKKWQELNDREEHLDKYRHCLAKCRTYVKDLADHWFWPLTVNLVIHAALVSICAVQILLRWFYYHQRLAMTKGTTTTRSPKPTDEPIQGIDDPWGVLWYAGLAILATVQVLVFLPRLCSINDRADELGQYVMENKKFKRHSTFSLAELVLLAEKCPVSFPILCFRLSTTKVFAALVAAMLSMLGLGVSSLKRFVEPTECQCR